MNAQEAEQLLREAMVQLTDGYTPENKITVGKDGTLFVCATRGKHTDYLALHYIREFLIKNGFSVNNIEIFSHSGDVFSIRVMANYIGGKLE